MHFTYSFPAGFASLYLVQLQATTGNDAYAPGWETRTDM